MRWLKRWMNSSAYKVNDDIVRMKIVCCGGWKWILVSYIQYIKRYEKQIHTILFVPLWSRTFTYVIIPECCITLSTMIHFHQWRITSHSWERRWYKTVVFHAHWGYLAIELAKKWDRRAHRHTVVVLWRIKIFDLLRGSKLIKEGFVFC